MLKKIFIISVSFTNFYSVNNSPEIFSTDLHRSIKYIEIFVLNHCFWDKIKFQGYGESLIELK